MTNIIDKSTFDTVPLIEVGDEIKGGLDGASNKQGIALANRTKYLNDQLAAVPETIDDKLTEFKGAPNPLPQYITKNQADGDYLQLEGNNLPGGAVTLDANGKIPSSFLNFVTSTYVVVANKAARLALSTSPNLQIVVQQDEDKLYYLNGNTPANVDGNWFPGQSATVNGVASVFGRTGTVLAESGDYTTEQITETPTKVFVSPTEKTSWSQKQAALVSGVNIVTLFGKTLLGNGDYKPTPADMGAAAAIHKHAISDVTGLDNYVINQVANSFEAGSGVALGVNPKTNKLTLAVNPATGEQAGFVTVDRPGSVAAQSHDFNFVRSSKWALDAFAFKRISGLANQVQRYDTFLTGNFTDYKLTPHLTNSTTLGFTVPNIFGMNPENGFYKGPTHDLNDLKATSFVAQVGDASIVPALSSNTSSPGYTASASGGAGSQAAWRAFDGAGTGDWYVNGTPANQWLRIDLPNPAKVASYSLKNRPQGSYAVLTWTLQGSNDNGTTWTDLHAGNTGSYGANYQATYNVPAASQGLYLSYRIKVNTVVSGTQVSSISQWQLFQAPGKILLKGSDGNYYKSANGVISQTPAPTSQADFDKNGFVDSGIIPAAQWGTMTTLTAYNYMAVNYTLNTFPKPQIALPVAKRGITIFQILNSFSFSLSTKGSGVLALALTKDNKEYFAYKNGAWTSIGVLTSDSASAALLCTNGNTWGELTNLAASVIDQFYNGDYSTFGIAYGFDYTTVNDVAQVSYVQLVGNFVDTWQYQAPSEVTISRRPDGITFKTVQAGDYKLCYQIP